MSVLRSLTFCGTFSCSLVLILLSLSVLGQDDSFEVRDASKPGTVVIASTTLSEVDKEPEDLQHGEDEEDNQVESVIEHEEKSEDEQEDENCPCITKSVCPRVYGVDPMDFSTFGQLSPCKEPGLVRCCGVSVSA